MTTDLSSIRFDAQGLVPVVAQDILTGDVLLVAFMNADALERTLTTGEAHFWSRTRNALWRKGESSGHTLRVEEIRINCEGNSLLLRVRLTGPGACHDGYRSCYYRRLESDGTLTIVAEPAFDPGVVYGGASPGLEAALRELYAGYIRLRDEDFTTDSQTSRMLRDPDTTAEQFVARAQEELAELEGVVAGTHRHSGTRDDLLLEASQVLYWLCLAAARDDLTYDDWHPHLALTSSSSPFSDSRADQDLAPAGSPSPFYQMERGSAGWSGARGGAILAQVARLLARAGVAPIEPVQRDLAPLRKRLATS